MPHRNPTIVVLAATFWLGHAVPLNASLMKADAGTVFAEQNYDNFGGAASLLGTGLASADVNADGYRDLIVGAGFYSLVPGGVGGSIGKAYLYLGGPLGLSESPVWTHTGDDIGDRFGSSIASGDINGDGFDDVLIGAPDWGPGQYQMEGAVFLFLGSASGLEASPSWMARSLRPDDVSSSLFGLTLDACDVNGDGFDDVLVAAPGYLRPDGSNGYVFVYLGSATGPGPTGTPDNADWKTVDIGYAVSSAGDVDADGFCDVIVGDRNYDAPGPGLTQGGVFLFQGSRRGLGDDGTSVNADWKAQGASTGYGLGTSVDSAGDVDGNGRGDIIVGSSFGRAHVWLAGGNGLGQSGTSSDADWIVDPPATGLSSFGDFVAGIGDVNGDGFDDVLVTDAYTDVDNPSSGAERGAVFVWFGRSSGLGPGGPETSADWIVKGTAANDRMGYGAAALGDVDGDGLADVAIAELGAGNAQVRLHLGTCGSVVDDTDGDGLAPIASTGCTSGLFRVDCDDHNGGVWGIPGEARSLIVQGGSSATISWGAPRAIEMGARPAELRYDLVRSSDASDFVPAATCLASGIPTTAFDDAETPSTGTVLNYLARAVNACPGGIGSSGNDSAGVPRSVRSCP